MGSASIRKLWYNGTNMNWVATNIRFPEEEYQKLKMKAARERKSLAAVIREAVNQVVHLPETEKVKKTRAQKIMAEVRRIAKDNAKYTKGFDSVKALREIRYAK